MNNITTLILVAGKSSRFKSNQSKIFHELGGLPIIDHIYYKAKKISKNKIVFICNKNNYNTLKKRYKNCKFALQKKQNGTADAVLSAKKFIKNKSNILILFGDVPLISSKTLKKLINFFNNKKLPGSMLAFKSNNPFGYGRVIAKGKKVESVIEEINASQSIKKISLCNAGVMLCKYKILFSFINKINNKNIKREKYLPDIFSICHQNKKSFYYILCEEEEMLGINTIKDFNKVDEIYQTLLKNHLIEKGVKILNPKTVRVSYDTQVGKNSTIEPFVYIKEGVKIKNQVIIKSHTILEFSIIGNGSSVGPFARLRPGTLVGENVKIGNFVEIKNSIIGKQCSIGHLSYIGDSQLGKNINIGAGTITCNYDGKNKYKTIIEDNVFIGTNNSLIAPLRIRKNSKTGAGSIIRKNIPPNSLVVGLDKLVKSKKIDKK